MRDKRGAEVDVAKPVGTYCEKDDDGAELDDEALETGIAPDEDAIDWLERLRTDPPDLSLLLDFVVSSKSQEVSMTRESFHQQLSWCFKKLGLGTVQTELEEQLFNRAIPDVQMKSAYDAFLEVLQSQRFNETLQYIQEELNRLELFTKFLRLPREFAVPQSFSEWESIWIGSLRQLIGTFKNQLLSGEGHLVALQEFLHFGRTQLRSHLLLVAHSSIANLIKGKKPLPSVYKLLVAYADASQLIPYRDSAADGEIVDSMKNRIARAKLSKMIIPMLSILLAQVSKENQATKN